MSEIDPLALADHFPSGAWLQPDGAYAGQCFCSKTFSGKTLREARQAWALHAKEASQRD